MTEQAKKELIKRLKNGDLDGMEEILDKINPNQALTISFLKDLNPKAVDKFYTLFQEYYKNKGKGNEHYISLAASFQKRHREKHKLELEELYKGAAE